MMLRPCPQSSSTACAYLTILLSLLTAPLGCSQAPEGRSDCTVQPALCDELGGCDPLTHACRRMLVSIEGSQGKFARPFAMDVHEVTVAEYQACAEGPALCQWPSYDPQKIFGCNFVPTNSPGPSGGTVTASIVPGREEHPMNCIGWEQAKTYCEKQGGRLPSRQELTWVAVGTTSASYPWGDAPASQSLACGSKETGPKEDKTCPVCKFPPTLFGQISRGPGFCDISGNAWEWVSDAFCDSDSIEGDSCTTRDPNCRMVTGGSFYDPPDGLFAGKSRCLNIHESKNNNAGRSFRCVYDLASAPAPKS